MFPQSCIIISMMPKEVYTLTISLFDGEDDLQWWNRGRITTNPIKKIQLAIRRIIILGINLVL